MFLFKAIRTHTSPRSLDSLTLYNLSQKSALTTSKPCPSAFSSLAQASDSWFSVSTFWSLVLAPDNSWFVNPFPWFLLRNSVFRWVSLFLVWRLCFWDRWLLLRVFLVCWRFFWCFGLWMWGILVFGWGVCFLFLKDLNFGVSVSLPLGIWLFHK